MQVSVIYGGDFFRLNQQVSFKYEEEKKVHLSVLLPTSAKLLGV